VIDTAFPAPTAAPGDGDKAGGEAPVIEPRLPGDAPARPGSAADVFCHDEWNYLDQRYLKAWTQVHEQRLRGEDMRFLAQLRQRHAGLAASIRRRIGKVRPLGRERMHRARDGDEIDVDAAIQERIEHRAGQRGDGRVYAAQQPARREVCTAFLLDISGSTGFVVPNTETLAADDGAPGEDEPYFYASPRRSPALQPPRRRVIDVSKDAIGLMCDALARLGDRHAVWGFSGDGRHQVDFYIAKGFDDAWSAHSAAALARMEPKGSTRTGAAIRHAARKLARQPERMRLLIVVTDGYPQDSDYGPDPQDSDYGLRDTAQAMQEAERAGIMVFCVSVDHAAHDYLRRLCPPSRYLVIDEVGALPEQLAKVYRRLISCR
jgi:nitric oxide reductase activation protein